MFVGSRPPIDEMAELCKTMNIKQMAEHYGTYERLVWAWLKKYDLKAIPRSKGHRKTISVDDIKRCLDDGMNVSEIANAMNVSKETVYNRMKEKGLKLKDLIQKKEKKEVVKSGTIGYWCKYAGQGKHDCKYWATSEGVCDYYVRTGNRRPCPADNCTVYEKRGKGEALGKWESKRVY